MTEMTATPDAEEAISVDEFLGGSTQPRWRRWAKYWVPGLIVLLAALYFTQSSGDDKPDYITEAVVQRSLDIEVTATGNLRPTNQVDVGATGSMWTSTTASRAGKCSPKSTPT
jgi:HlyD family secretion protein